jgi:hypothetical protein
LIKAAFDPQDRPTRRSSPDAHNAGTAISSPSALPSWLLRSLMSDVHQGFPTYRRIAPLDDKAAHPEEARRIAANIAKLPELLRN